MELGTISIGVVVIALSAMPFVLMAKGKKRKQKELLDKLKNIAASLGSDVANVDYGRKMALGISSAKNYILFYKETKDKIVEKTVPVNTLLKCEVNEAKQRVRVNKRTEEILERIELVFYSKDKSAAPISFELYNADEYLQLNGELQLAKKWHGITKEAMEFYAH
ncbi:hypothetical protein AB9K32_09385 [Allomuricauda sp. XS_ASV26]|uniref:hypothetical protein n=1 Tax=Allomuricauda sp. XS_ASV26 TaxID=3241292 RepID=UPI00351303CC